jgi:hypothetical protein
MIRLACVVHGTNYSQRGRTVDDMGLKGLRVGEVRRYVQEGRITPPYDLVFPRSSLAQASPKPAGLRIDQAFERQSQPLN